MPCIIFMMYENGSGLFSNVQTFVSDVICGYDNKYLIITDSVINIVDTVNKFSKSMYLIFYYFLLNE